MLRDKGVATFVEELAKEYAGRVRIGKLDIDEDRETPTRFDVMAVPTLIFFKGALHDAGRGTPDAVLRRLAQGEIDKLEPK